MFCDGCGSQVGENQSFCPRCGKALGTAATSMPTSMPVSAPSRIARHLRIVGILWLVLSALRLLPGLALMVIFRPDGQLLPAEVPPFVPHLVQTVGFVFIAVGVLGLLTGWGLLSRQSWARMAAIVFGGISLLDVPFGTALGIYTLWVLLPVQSEQEYRQIAPAA